MSEWRDVLLGEMSSLLLWPFSDRRMPLAAVAVALGELPDERARRVGRELIDRPEVG